MRIAEIFYTLQGEGSYIGTPCVFIRTSGCPLRCSWCDTKYASWYPEGDQMTVAEILEATLKWLHVKHFIISGGEPTIQKHMPALITQLRDRGHFVTVETAGIVTPGLMIPDLWSISPKLSNSMPDQKKESQLHRRNNTFKYLRRYIDQCWKWATEYQIKFVVSGMGELPEIYGLVNDLEIDKDHVYLMPEGVTEKELKSRSLAVAEICKVQGFTFTPRLHIELWGNTKGT